MNVTDMPALMARCPNKAGYRWQGERKENKRFLPDGRRYVVYRFALYMDGVKSLRDTQFVGGCYLLPLGLSMDIRKTIAAPRVLAIAADSQNHNKVMNLILDDIAEGSRTGVDGVDSYGSHVRIFLDRVSFFWDYPAITLCSDVLGHTGNAFCAHCLIKKIRTPGLSTILRMPMNHSRLIAFTREDNRFSEEIRKGNYPPELYRALGLKGISMEERKK